MQRRIKRLIWHASFVTLAAICLPLGVYLCWKWTEHEPNNPTHDKPSSQIILPKGSKEKLQADAERCLQNFWRAGNYETKLAFVRDPKRVAPMMRSFYVDKRHRDPEEVALQSTAPLTLGSTRLQHFIFKAKFISGQERKVEAALIEDKSGMVRLDWESYLGVGDMDWGDFRKERPIQSVKLRAYLTPSKYYNFKFEDSQRYAAVQLENAEGDQTLHAYCERGSEDYLKIAAMLQRNEGQPSPVTVMLAFPRNAKSDNCVKLEKLVAESWLVLE